MVTMVVPLFSSDLGIGLLSNVVFLPGVLQEGTCDGRCHLASDSTGRRADLSSTSDVEALLCFCWSSALLCRQVVRPLRLGGVQWWRIFAGRGPSSISSLFLGGDASRTSACGGRDTQGLECFFNFLFGVFYVNEEP
jgi:hypothetical protein